MTAAEITDTIDTGAAETEAEAARLFNPDWLASGLMAMDYRRAIEELAVAWSVEASMERINVALAHTRRHPGDDAAWTYLREEILREVGHVAAINLARAQPKPVEVELAEVEPAEPPRYGIKSTGPVLWL